MAVKKSAASKTVARQAAAKPEQKEPKRNVPKKDEEMANDPNGLTPVERSGLTSISQDDLNPAFAIDTSK